MPAAWAAFNTAGQLICPSPTATLSSSGAAPVELMAAPFLRSFTCINLRREPCFSINFEGDKFRLRLSHHQVKQRAIAVRLKFIPMAVIGKCDSRVPELFASGIEDLGGFS